MKPELKSGDQVKLNTECGPICVVRRIIPKYYNETHAVVEVDYWWDDKFVTVSFAIDQLKKID